MPLLVPAIRGGEGKELDAAVTWEVGRSSGSKVLLHGEHYMVAFVKMGNISNMSRFVFSILQAQVFPWPMISR